RERKTLRACSGSSTTPKDSLNSIKFGFGHHRFVLAPMPSAASTRVFKPAVIERICEDSVDTAPGKKFRVHFSIWPRSKAPLSSGDFKNPRRAVKPGEHQIPHAPEQWKAIRVLKKTLFT